MKPYPPLLFLGGLLLALVGHLLAPLALPPGWWRWPVGIALLVVTGALALAADREMSRAKTPVMPFQDATTLVTTGPFRFSRNPIYLSFAVSVLGLACLSGSWWPLITLPLPLVAVTYVIRGEEARLNRLFGAQYAAYRRRTRRWL